MKRIETQFTKMNSEIDKEFSHVITETLKAVLSPDKALIDQAQMQLKVLQVRQGWLLICFYIAGI